MARRKTTTIPKKGTNADIAMRVEAVRCLILEGANRYDILQFCSENWGVGERQADEYMERARKKIMEVLDRKREEHMAEHIDFRRHLRRKAMKAQDSRLALEVARDEAKLLDLYPAMKNEHTIRDMSQLTDDELRAIVEAKSSGGA